MSLKLYNFLSKKIEEFKPIKNGEVGLYTCGPTAYNYVHIGNWRTFIFEDVLKRVLEFNGLNVSHVMNITDIDDKIIKKANDEKVDFKEITKKYEGVFFVDLKKLNILPAEKYTRATSYIQQMIDLIQKLLDKGVAYKGDDGIYFAVEKFKDYGKLSGLEKRELKKGARVNDDQYDKENWSDFALWKFPKGGEPSWPSPFGEGRPGWHIECSAMSIAELGDSFDIHTGGVDLLFPHHENEIAQSEAATGKKFVNFWMEGEHLLVEEEKMSKSLGNVYTLEDIVKGGFDPLALRYLFLTAHYRSKLNFTWKSLGAAQNALNNLREIVAGYQEAVIGCSEFEQRFKDSIDNDLDIPKGLSVMWEMVKSDYPDSAKHQSVLVMNKVLGLGLDKIAKAELPRGAEELIEKRELERKGGNFEESDKMRRELLEMGVEVEDTSEGPKWKIKKKN
ncbi:MAG: cysteine--tRNA ligase [Candidatus Curtissbacteria bacterium]|nr:cysteine--tRNA ligase [Candidatus Curtissbacteria bacterium]